MLDRERLDKVRRIRIRTRAILDTGIVGAYHAVFKGRGMEFAEVREYQPGDDVRTIDWNVSARMNDAYVKLFVEEREMTVLLLVDMSASGRFGSAEREKRELAAELAAVLAFSAIKNNDRVGLIIFTDEVERFVPPKKGKKHVLRVISEILSFAPKSPRTDLAVGLDFMGHVAHHRSVAFLVSDFLSPERSYEHALRIASRRHDLIPVVVSDPLESQLPRVGLIDLYDPETGELVVFDSSGPEARAFAKSVRAQETSRESLFRRLSLDPIEVSTATPYLPALTSFFEARARRLRH
jgi:uncharacterized protein (DUF58 family)